MRNKTLLMLAVMALASCTDKKPAETVTEDPAAVEVVDNTATDADTLAEELVAATPEANSEGTEITVKGEVKEILQGKDGYTATIKMADGKRYMATISIPNLKDPKQYRKFNVGDVIKVKGKSFTVEEDIVIKVEELW